jgi:hypothetical protein
MHVLAGPVLRLCSAVSSPLIDTTDKSAGAAGGFGMYEDRFYLSD